MLRERWQREQRTMSMEDFREEGEPLDETVLMLVSLELLALDLAVIWTGRTPCPACVCS